MKFPSIACSLSSAELRERVASVLARFRPAVNTMEELPNGYAFTFEGDRKWIALAAEVMAAERDCCPFLKFEVVAEPDHGPFVVRVTGPDGSKEFLKTILVEAKIAP